MHDHLDDLRAQLPAQFRDHPDSQIAPLWIAWDAARHGHSIEYLIETCAVTADIAEQLITLANPGHGGKPSTP